MALESLSYKRHLPVSSDASVCVAAAEVLSSSGALELEVREFYCKPADSLVSLAAYWDGS